jgi:hypothetical protein
MTHFVIFSGSFALVHNSPHGDFSELRASSFSFLAYTPRSRRYKGQVSFDAIRGCWTTEFRFLANPPEGWALLVAKNSGDADQLKELVADTAKLIELGAEAFSEQ